MRVTKAIRCPNCFFARSQEFDLFTSPSFYGTKEEGKLSVDSLFTFSLSIPLHNRHTFPADYLASLNNLLAVSEPSSQKKNETKEPILSCFVF